MTLNPRIWYPIAVVGSLVNVAGFAFAASSGEPWHAALHAGLAAGLAVWAQHLKARRTGELGSGSDAELANLRDDVGDLRREVSELQERMDFAERVLSQARDMERLSERKPLE
jgi:hypothetical protein